MKKLDPTEIRLAELGVNVYDIKYDDAYLHTADLLNRTETHLNNVIVENERNKALLVAFAEAIKADNRLIAMYNGSEFDTLARQNAIDSLAVLASKDAISHGLYEDYDKIDDVVKTRRALAGRIAMECKEAMDAATDEESFIFEMADVLLMTLSAVGYLKLRDFGEYVELKRLINHERPYKHGKSDGND